MKADVKPPRWVRSATIVRDRDWQVWRRSVLSGSLFGVFLPAILAAISGKSPWMAGSAALFAALCALTLAMTRKVFYGYESYTFYHYHLVVLGAATVFLYVFRQPLLTYLDLVALGLASALAVGRIGCLMAGCCYGRPHKWGVYYGPEHAKAGFPAYLVGIRLFPVQLAESVWVCLVLAAGSMLILNGAPAGAALTWYAVAYGLGRFTFEFLRGDLDRPYHRGYSTAQWVSLLLVAGVASAEFVGSLPLSWWHVSVAALLVVLILIVTARRRMDDTARHDLLHPRHVKEIADAIKIKPINRPIDIGVIRTSLNICISASGVGTTAQMTDLYTLSADRRVMKRDVAEILAGLIIKLRHHEGPRVLIEGNNGVFHLLIKHNRKG